MNHMRIDWSALVLCCLLVPSCSDDPVEEATPDVASDVPADDSSSDSTDIDASDVGDASDAAFDVSIGSGSLELPEPAGELEGLVFEETSEGVFVANSPNYAARIEGSTVELLVQNSSLESFDEPVRLGPPDVDAEVRVVRLEHLRTNEARPVGRNPVERRLHHRQDDESERTGFAEVQIEDFYPGITAVFSGRYGRLKLSYELEAGADAGDIEFTLPDSVIEVERSGQINAETEAGTLVITAPEASQGSGGGAVPIPAGINSRDDEILGIVLGPHDADQPVRIDPTFVFTDLANSPTFDRTWAGGRLGDVLFATGDVSSAWLEAGEVVQSTLQEGFVAFREVGGDETHFLDDPGFDTLRDIVSLSADQTAAVGGSHNGDDLDVTVVRVGPDNETTALVFGGEGFDIARAVEAGADGTLFFVGETSSSSIGTAERTIGEYGGASDAFIATVVDEELTAFGYLGGMGTEAAWDIVDDEQGNLWVVGFSDGDDLASLTEPAGGFDVLVARFDTSLELEWVRLFGTAEDDFATSAAVNPAGGIAVAGLTRSDDGSEDAFLLSLDEVGNEVAWAEIQGAEDELAWGVAVDSSGYAWVVGTTNSPDLFTGDPPEFAVGENGFVAQVSTTTGGVTFVTQLGGEGQDALYDIELGETVVLSGASDSLDWVTLAELAVQEPLRLGSAFVLELEPDTVGEENARPEAIIDLPSPGSETNLSCDVTLDGSSSNDSDGELVRFDWRVEIGGTHQRFDDLGPTLSLRPVLSGELVVRLTVTDDQGASDTAEVRALILEPHGLLRLDGVSVDPPTDSAEAAELRVDVENVGDVETGAFPFRATFDLNGDDVPTDGEPSFDAEIPSVAGGGSGTAVFDVSDVPSGSNNVIVQLDPDGELLGCSSPVQFVLEDLLFDFEAPAFDVSDPALGATVSARPSLTVSHSDEHSNVLTDSLEWTLVGEEGTWNESDTLTTGNSTRAILSVDLNGDGLSDLVTASAGRLDAFVNNEGSLENVFSRFFVSETFISVDVADIAGDENLDIVAVDSSNRVVRVFPGDGPGSFDEDSTFTLEAGCVPDLVAAADIHPDPGSELVVGCAISGDLAVLHRPEGDWQSIAVADEYWAGVDDAPSEIHTGILDDSGLSSVVVVGTSKVVTLAYSAELDPPFSTGGFALGGFLSVGVGDLTADGVDDVFVANTAGSRCFVNDGDGGFDASAWTPAAFGSQFQRTTVGHVGVDGAVDVVIADRNGAAVVVLEGEGDCSFGDPINVSVGRVPWGVAIVADPSGPNMIAVADQAAASSGSGTLVLTRDTLLVTEQLSVSTQTPTQTVFELDGDLGDGRYQFSITGRDTWQNEGGSDSWFTVAGD